MVTKKLIFRRAKIISLYLILVCLFSFEAEASWIKRLIIREAKVMGIDPRIALAIATIETRLKPGTITPEDNVNDDSIGLFQVRTDTAKWACKIHTVKELLNIEKNTRCALSYLQDQILRYNGDINKAVLAYNAGSYKVKRNGIPVNIGYLNNFYEVFNENINFNLVDPYGFSLSDINQGFGGSRLGASYYIGGLL